MYLNSRDGRRSTRGLATFTDSAKVCAPVAVLNTPDAQVSLLGSPAVSIRVITAPMSELRVTGGLTTKIDNSISTTTSAKGDGLTLSVNAAWDHQVQVDKVKGGMAPAIQARGIPPRGRPV